MVGYLLGILFTSFEDSYVEVAYIFQSLHLSAWNPVF
jgi:hypothetical protein